MCIFICVYSYVHSYYIRIQYVRLLIYRINDISSVLPFLLDRYLGLKTYFYLMKREKCTKTEKKPSKTGKNSSALLALCVLLILTRARVSLAFIFDIQGVFTYHVCAVTVQSGYIVYLIYARVRIHTTHTHTRKCRYNSNAKYAQQPEI